MATFRQTVPVAAAELKIYEIPEFKIIAEPKIFDPDSEPEVLFVGSEKECQEYRETTRFEQAATHWRFICPTGRSIESVEYYD